MPDETKEGIKKEILDLVREHGRPPQQMLKEVGLNSRTYYRWRAEDPAWNWLLTEAREAVGDRYENMLLKAAEGGDVKAIIAGLKMAGRLTDTPQVQVNLLDPNLLQLSDIQLRQVVANAVPQLEDSEEEEDGGLKSLGHCSLQ